MGSGHRGDSWSDSGRGDVYGSTCPVGRAGRGRRRDGGHGGRHPGHGGSPVGDLHGSALRPHAALLPGFLILPHLVGRCLPAHQLFVWDLLSPVSNAELKGSLLQNPRVFMEISRTTERNHSNPQTAGFCFSSTRASVWAERVIVRAEPLHSETSGSPSRTSLRASTDSSTVDLIAASNSHRFFLHRSSDEKEAEKFMQKAAVLFVFSFPEPSTSLFSIVCANSLTF